MSGMEIVGLCIISFWLGLADCKLWMKKREKPPSTYEVFGRELVTAFAKLKSNMRFVGSHPDLSSSYVGEYTFGDLGVCKITMEPVAPSPMTDAVARGI